MRVLFQNSPLYIGGIGNDTGTDNELSRQWLVHTALDALEERLATTNTNAAGAGSNPARTDMRDLYLGLLYSTDTHKMYVYPKISAKSYTIFYRPYFISYPLTHGIGFF